MADIKIANETLGFSVTTTGGAVWRFFAKAGGEEIPLFRTPPEGGERPVLKAGCFPLVPFGNRVRGNRFSFEGGNYTLQPNMAWDRHYLHGDGWTGEWEPVESSKTSIAIRYRHEASGTPYVYEAEQCFSLVGATLTTFLSVTNRGEVALPFGLGWHPYFPLTERTTLTAKADFLWDEDSAWLPTQRRGVEGDVDFAHPRGLPRRWVNTVFEGWNGRAAVVWPEMGLSLRIDADSLFSRYLVFVSDPAFDAGYAYDFFCFEPMSHSVDAHNMASSGGLVRLAPGESLSGSVRYTCGRFASTA